MKSRFPRAGLLGLAVISLLCLPIRSQAALDMFLSFAGVSGEATNGLIAISAFQWGIGRAITSPAGGSREAAVPSVSEVTITKAMDVASPQLALLTVSGASGVTCVITVVDHNTGNTLYKVNLGNVLLSGYSVSSSGDRPSESISLNFTTITWSYQQLDSSGNKVGSASSPVGWDLVLRKTLP